MLRNTVSRTLTLRSTPQHAEQMPLWSRSTCTLGIPDGGRMAKTHEKHNPHLADILHSPPSIYLSIYLSSLRISLAQLYVDIHYITLQYITSHYKTLRYITAQYITLQYNTLHYITAQYITLQYSTLHYSTVHYVTLQ